MNYTCWFSDDMAANSDLVGDKGASLNRLAAGGFPVPPGFCITVDAYRYLLRVTGLDRTIAGLLEAIDFEDQEEAESKMQIIRDLIEEQPIPNEIAGEVLDNYFKLGRQMGLRHLEAMPVAVRPSVTVEDSGQTAFSDRLDTSLNIRGGYAILKQARRCWASFWDTQALFELQRLGIEPHKVKIAVIVQSMANSESASTLNDAHTFA